MLNIAALFVQTFKMVKGLAYPQEDVAPEPGDNDLSKGVEVTVNLLKGKIHEIYQGGKGKFSIRQLFKITVLGSSPQSINNL